MAQGTQWQKEQGMSALPMPEPDQLVNNKYRVFKRDTEEEIYNCVVIRLSDVFAAPALEAYANAIQCVIEALDIATEGPAAERQHLRDHLRDIADYFHQQAEKSYDANRKLPD